MCVCVYMCVCISVCMRVYVYVCFLFFFPAFLYSIEKEEEEEREKRGEKKKKLDDSAVPEKSFLSTPENRAEQLPRSAQDTLLLQFLGLRLVVGKTLRLPGRALLHFGG